MTMHQAKLCRAQGKIPVTAVSSKIPEHRPRAVHGLEGKGGFIYFGEIHILGVIVPVPRALPQALVENLGSADFHIPIPGMLLPPELEKFIPNNDAVGVVNGHAGSILADRKQVQFPAQLAVIPLLGFLQQGQMLFQLALLGKGCAVYPLQHGLVLITPPVGTGHAQQLKDPDSAGAAYMGPGA